MLDSCKCEGWKRFLGSLLAGLFKVTLLELVMLD